MHLVGHMGVAFVQWQLLSSNLPVYIFLGGVAISQKLKNPLQRQKHEIQLAQYTIYWANVWGKVRLVRQY